APAPAAARHNEGPPGDHPSRASPTRGTYADGRRRDRPRLRHGHAQGRVTDLRTAQEGPDGRAGGPDGAETGRGQSGRREAPARAPTARSRDSDAARPRHSPDTADTPAPGREPAGV